MVVDTSALVAILCGEPDAQRLLDELAADPDPIVSTATLLEARIVLHARYGIQGTRHLHELLDAAGASVVPVDRDVVDAAYDGWVRFGKGRHPAALNFGDAFTYGLAKVRGEPVLHLGDDFGGTDLAEKRGG